MNKILITGSTGNVGRPTIEHLLKMGETVKAATFSIDEAKKVLPKSVEIVEFDFLKSETYEKALAGVDRVFLMRPPNLGKPEQLAPFVEAMKAHGVKLVAFLSLMGVENNPIPPHHKIEKLIEKLELPFVHIRPSFFMQNITGVHAIDIRQKDEIYIPAGKSKTSFIDADNIGEAVATVLHSAEKYKNTAHTITGPEALNYYQVAAILSEVTGRKIRYAKPSFLSYRNRYIKVYKMAKDYINVTVMLYLMTRLGTAKKITTQYQDLTGKKPTTFKDFAIKNKQAFEKTIQ